MRWIWIDKFIEFEPGVVAKAVKVLSSAEDHFDDHMPGFPVMPASLMLEGLAQTGGILAGHARGFREKVILAKIPKASFAREAVPGETLVYEARLLDLRDEGAVVAGRITSGGDAFGEAEIFFAHLDQAQDRALTGGENFVFTGELKKILGLNNLLPGPAADPDSPPAPPTGD